MKNKWLWFLSDSFQSYLHSITFGRWGVPATGVCWPCFLSFCLACLVCVASGTTFSFRFREGSLVFVTSLLFLESLLSFAWSLSLVGLKGKVEKNTAKRYTLRRWSCVCNWLRGSSPLGSRDVEILAFLTVFLAFPVSMWGLTRLLSLHWLFTGASSLSLWQHIQYNQRPIYTTRSKVWTQPLMQSLFFVFTTFYTAGKYWKHKICEQRKTY